MPMGRTVTPSELAGLSLFIVTIGSESQPFTGVPRALSVEGFTGPRKNLAPRQTVQHLARWRSASATTWSFPHSENPKKLAFSRSRRLCALSTMAATPPGTRPSFLTRKNAHSASRG